MTGSSPPDSMARAEHLAAAFAAVDDEIAALVTACSEEQWRQATASEGWTVAAVARHIAEVQGAFAGIVATLADGRTFSPRPSMDDVDRGNAEQARAAAAADRAETLALQRTNAERIGALLQRMTDADLDRVAGVFGGNELSVAQVIEYVVIGHAREHLASLRSTLTG